MLNARLSLAFIALGLFASCSQKSASSGAPPAPNTGLSHEENEYVQSLEKNNKSSQTVPMVVYSALSQPLPESVKPYVSNSGQGLTELNVPASQVRLVEDALLRSNPNFVVTLNLFAEVEHTAPGLEANEQLLFSGKEEFGIHEWRQKYPLADGRGVAISIVDDGVALGRPGLLTNSVGAPKIARSVNTSPLWQLPIVKQPSACTASLPKSHAATETKNWKVIAGTEYPELDRATFLLPFDISPCGINPYLSRRPSECVNWGQALGSTPEAYTAALYAEFGEKAYVFADVNKDGEIVSTEVLAPVSQNGGRFYRLADGRTLGFDVHDTQKILPPAAETDNPLRCVETAIAEKTISLVVPQLSTDFGSHGEGVASIAAGYRIANRNFDGVAPGAQVVDVHFGDFMGGRRYTIAEVGRVLKIGGMHADVVNLSYSLFFSTPAAQVAMGRLYEALLKDTGAIYFFSAGNNGPGRGSMNRALIYPSFSIPVAAYLNPLLSQTTFGSAIPVGGVVTYSSRGPGVDGGAGALLLSPLAGIVASTADAGFGPFSGTSSATPAVAGFAARLLSQIKQEALPLRRDLLKLSLLQSGRPVAHASFVDQGYGLPHLPTAIEKYRELVSAEQNFPPLDVAGGTTSQGVTRKGVYVRGESDKLDLYTFKLTPSFGSEWREDQRAQYGEHVVLSTNQNWIRVPANAFVPRGGATVQVAVAYADLNSNESLGEITIRNADTLEIRGVIPVTVLTADSREASELRVVSVEAGKLSRVFLAKPTWATHLAIASSATNRALCGRFLVYNPAGVNMTQLKANASTNAFIRERVFSTHRDGLYEVILDGKTNHQACVANQNQQLRFQWINLNTNLFSAKIDNTTEGRATISTELQLATDSPFLAGTLSLSRPSTSQTVFLQRTGKSYEFTSTQKLDLSGFKEAEFNFSSEFISRQAFTLGYPYWALELFTNESAMPLANSLAFDAPLAVVLDGDVSQVSAVVSSFDIGLDSVDKQISMQVRGVKSEHLTAKVDVGDVVIRAGQPSIVKANISDVAGNADVLSGATLRCEFIPLSMSLRVPCGFITLP